MARTAATSDLVGLLVRLRTNVQLVDHIDLDALAKRYGGPGSTEHDDIQTLIAFAREQRTIERALNPRDRNRSHQPRNAASPRW